MRAGRQQREKRHLAFRGARRRPLSYLVEAGAPGGGPALARAVCWGIPRQRAAAAAASQDAALKRAPRQQGSLGVPLRVGVGQRRRLAAGQPAAAAQRRPHAALPLLPALGRCIGGPKRRGNARAGGRRRAAAAAAAAVTAGAAAAASHALRSGLAVTLSACFWTAESRKKRQGGARDNKL